MFINYLTSAARSFLRQPTYAAINVFGLGLGMACCLLILLFVRHELSFDFHHPAPERTYRLVLDSEPRVPTPLLAVVREQVPNVERAAAFRRPFHPMIAHGEKRLYEAINVAEEGLFQILEFPLLQGDPTTALRGVGSMVVTRDFAHRYFDREDVVGESLLWDGRVPYRITGVVEIPTTSHLAFEAVISYQTMLAQPGFGYSELWRYRHSAYVVLAPGADPKTTVGEILLAVERHLGVEKRQELEEDGLALQRVTAIRRYSTWRDDTADTGSHARLLLLSTVAAAILCMACVNFTNLATARSVRRAREVGLRKAIGARRSQLLGQFLAESLLLGSLSLVVALGLTGLRCRPSQPSSKSS